MNLQFILDKIKSKVASMTRFRSTILERPIVSRFGTTCVLTGLLALLTIFCLIANGNQGEALIESAGHGNLKQIRQLPEKGSDATPQDNIIGLQTAQTDTASPVLTPACEPVPPKKPSSTLPVSFYRLRIKYSTTSDWTRLTIKNPANVLTLRVMSVSGKPSHFRALRFIWPSNNLSKQPRQGKLSV
ncbi:MAG: hypothetical protein ACLQPD_34690 [Desulfomonilaceae bacterium]